MEGGKTLDGRGKNLMNKDTGGQAEGFQPLPVLGLTHERIAVWEIYMPVYSSVEACLV